MNVSLIAALESIAANTCCYCCGEAKKVAQEALDKNRLTNTEDGV